MSEEHAYPSFNKIPRLHKAITVTEKIDGSNGLVQIEDGGAIRAGSRNRWLTTFDHKSQTGEVISTDNFGFGRWVLEHAEDLRKLGPGMHYGEWFGLGIQRGYGLQEKRFSLFHKRDDGPSCVGYVPILYAGVFDSQAIEETLHTLRREGSSAVPGFMRPEGIVVRFHVTGQLYKGFCEDD